MQQQIRNHLKTLAEPKYQQFSSALIPKSKPLLGVRIPLLRALAKQYTPKQAQALLEEPDEFFEEQMLRGFLLAKMGTTPAEKQQLILSFLPQIDNWSVCDSFCATLTYMKRSPFDYWDFLLCLCRSDQEFTVRFAVVCMLDHFLDTPYYSEVLALLPTIDHPGFYARTAVAWALTAAFRRNNEAVYTVLRKGFLNAQTQKLTIQKLLDSKYVKEPWRSKIRALRQA